MLDIVNLTEPVVSYRLYLVRSVEPLLIPKEVIKIVHSNT